MRNEGPDSDTSSTVKPALQDFKSIAGPFFTVFEQHTVPLIVAEVQTSSHHIVFVNDAFERLTGYAADDVVGQSSSILGGADTDGVSVKRIETALHDMRRGETAIVLYRKNGTACDVVASIFPVRVDAHANYVVLVLSGVGSSQGKAEEALRVSQKQLAEVNERLRVTLSLTGAAAAWEWHISRNRIVGDPRFAALYGLKSEEAAQGVSPEIFFSIIHPDDSPRVRLAIGGILRGAEVFSKEFRILLANHSVRWMQARGRCQYDDEDRPTRFSGVLIDITEQKLAAERLRIAQSAGGIGTFEHIEGFGTATVSQQFCNLLGLQPATDLPIHTINSVVHPDDGPLIVSIGGREHEETQSELRIIRRDTEEVRWIAKRGEYLRDAETAGLRFSGVIYDITESKHIEESLRSLNETLETKVAERTKERDGIWQLSKDMLGIADANGVWQSVNPAWTRVLGWQAREIVGRTSAWLQHPDDSPQTWIPRDTRAEGGLSFQSRLRTSERDYRSLAWTAVQQGGLFYCVARDVTEQLRREDSLARAEEQLRQAHKMEAVGQLTGGIAHDFNNMLTGVIASLGLIRRRIKAGRTDQLDEFIEAGMTSARRAAALTHSLLAFARRQSLDVKSQDVNGLITGIQEILRRPLGESITFTLALAQDLWPAFTDANQFENALLNLVLNARDAMPSGGELTIDTRNVHLEWPIAGHEGEIAGGHYVVVSVSDTGVGMAADIISKVFEPFFTTKPIGEGTGLGLSMIYGFVKQAGGHVQITSEVGRGTTVNMYLRRALPAEKEAMAAPEMPLQKSRGETILLVEDDISVRFTVSELLKELGYTFFEAPDAATAIPYLHSERSIDLLVTDVGLPHMNGRQLAAIARQHRPDLKVLFISGYSEMAADRSTFLEPGMQMLSKPFTVDSLSAKIRGLLEG